MVIKSKDLYLKVVFLIIFFNITFNYGFSNLGLRLGGLIIPINQIVLMWGLLRIVLRHKKFGIPKRYLVLILFSVFTIIRMIFCFTEYGSFALRDGTNYIDMLYVWVIYEELKSNTSSFVFKDKFWNFMDTLCWVSLTYFILMQIPFTSELLKTISPQYSGAQNEIALFSSTVNILLWQTIFAIFHASQLSNHHIIGAKRILYTIHLYLIFILILANFGSSGGRSTLISLIVVIILISIIGKKNLVGSLNAKILIIILLGFFLLLTGIVQKIIPQLSIDNMLNIFRSIWGEGDYTTKTGGTELRLSWWIEIVRYNFSSVTNLLFGRGFGMPLTNFTAGNSAIVREPHNSFMSVFGRTGIIGLVIFLFFIFKEFKYAYYRYKKLASVEALIVITMLTVLCIVALVETVFEVSYLTMPFYVLIVVMYYRDKENRIIQK